MAKARAGMGGAAAPKRRRSAASNIEKRPKKPRKPATPFSKAVGHEHEPRHHLADMEGLAKPSREENGGATSDPAATPPGGLRTALVYDFDGTLAEGNIQEHSLIPEHLGLTTKAFWTRVKAEAAAHDADEILAYMRLLLELARERGQPLTRDLLRSHGERTPLFVGVPEWFDRIDAHARERGLALDHYVISSGNEEMIVGTRVADRFRRIFASRYSYDARGEAVWPAVGINYTTKTQYLFRINKGVENHWDNDAVNRWQPMDERPVPFSRMIYLGDGDTDIPSMKMVRHQGGHSIAVFDPKRWERRELQAKVFNLIAEDRAHFVVPADYSDGSQLDVTIKGVLGRIARDEAGYREKS